MNYRNVLREMKKNGVFTIALIIQFIIMFFIIYNLLQIRTIVDAERQKVESYFKDKKVFTLRPLSANDFINSETKIGSDKLQETFQPLVNAKGFSYTLQSSFVLEMPVVNTWDKFALWSRLLDIEGNKYYAAKHLIVNKNAVEQFNLELQSGRFFNQEEYKLEYNKKLVPIILGYSYSRYYKVGDTISHGKDGQVYKVVGILKQNQYMPHDMMTERYANLDEYILTNTDVYSEPYQMYGGFLGPNFLLYNDDKSDDEIANLNNNIKKMFKDNLGINVRIEPQQKYINQELDAAENQLKTLNIAAVIIVVFLSISAVIARLSFIDKRKKEFGVHILSGGTTKDIALMMYLETITAIVIALLLFINIYVYQYTMINYVRVFYIFLIAVVISALFTMVPMIKILRLNTVELVRGEE